MVQSTDVIRLPAPEVEGPRRALLPAALLCLCLLLLTVSAFRIRSEAAENKGPTSKVVEALNLSRLPVAPALGPAPALTQDLTQPVLEGQPQPLEKMLLAFGKPIFLGKTGDRERAVECLALAAWYEAGNDIESQRSVIQVVLNRVAHPSFPKSVCGVVFQGSQRSTGCQFTFTCDGSMLRRQPSAAALARARALAEFALQGAVFPAVMQATHYHADYVQPWWSSQLVARGKVGRHIFYTWPGSRGVLPGRASSMGEASLTQLVGQISARGTIVPSPGAPAAQDMANPANELAMTGQADLVTVPSVPVAKPSSSIFLAIDTASPSGRWAISALGKCAGKNSCRVLGYENQDQLARNSAQSAAAREKPVFLFVRDPASGIELALWDCEKVSRPSPSQCLPAPGRELTRLLRDS